jgi:hypothetical protein
MTAWKAKTVTWRASVVGQERIVLASRPSRIWWINKEELNPWSWIYLDENWKVGNQERCSSRPAEPRYAAREFGGGRGRGWDRGCAADSRGPRAKISRCHSLSHIIFSPKVRSVTHYKLKKCIKETSLYRVSLDTCCHNVGTPMADSGDATVGGAPGTAEGVWHRRLPLRRLNWVIAGFGLGLAFRMVQERTNAVHTNQPTGRFSVLL